MLSARLDEYWLSALGTALGPGYVAVQSVSLAEMRLSVWAREEVAAAISEVETAKEACGVGGVVGGLAAGFEKRRGGGNGARFGARFPKHGCRGFLRGGRGGGSAGNGGGGGGGGGRGWILFLLLSKFPFGGHV